MKYIVEIQQALLYIINFTCFELDSFVLFHTWLLILYVNGPWGLELIVCLCFTGDGGLKTTKFASQKASNSRPPKWTTWVAWLEGFPSLLKAPSSRVPDCWWPQKNSRSLRGELAPAGPLLPSLRLRCVWFTACGNRLIQCSLSGLWADRHSTSGDSLGILGGISGALTHTHTSTQSSE